MNDFKITLQTLKDVLAVCRLEPNKGVPNWVRFDKNDFTSVTQTPDEFSIVCNQSLVPFDVKAEKNWRVIRIKGQLDFSLVGILKKVICPLSENKISIYTISTYDTDYILIKEDNFEKAMQILAKDFIIETL